MSMLMFPDIHKLKSRIIDISYRHKLSHIGSCLTTIDILFDLYQAHSGKSQDYKVILSNGHAGLAQYVMLEALYGFDAEMLLAKHGIHPNRDIIHNLVCSTGSLGHGIGIAIGLATANPEQEYYVVVSDGEMAEGSVYEAFRFLGEHWLLNLIVLVNYNGYGAFRATDIDQINKLAAFVPKSRVVVYYLKPPSVAFFEGLDAHYHVLEEGEYKQLMEMYQCNDL